MDVDQLAEDIINHRAYRLSKRSSSSDNIRSINRDSYALLMQRERDFFIKLMNNNIDKLVEHILYTHQAKKLEKKFKFKDACKTAYGYFFVDSEDGQCYLFDENGKMDDIRKLKALHIGDVKKDIEKIAIPESVENIRERAFFNCSSLKSIEIPKSVKSIGDWAFKYCTSLKSIEIPESIKHIGYEAFWNCTSLTSIEIPESIKHIGYEAFWNCTSLTSIEIPSSIESIRHWAFAGCTSLEKVIFKGKTIGQVETMNKYPWGIEDDLIIKCIYV